MTCYRTAYVRLFIVYYHPSLSVVPNAQQNRPLSSRWSRLPLVPRPAKAGSTSPTRTCSLQRHSRPCSRSRCESCRRTWRRRSKPGRPYKTMLWCCDTDSRKPQSTTWSTRYGNQRRWHLQLKHTAAFFFLNCQLAYCRTLEYRRNCCEGKV